MNLFLAGFSHLKPLCSNSNDGRDNRDGTVEETDFDMSFTGFESETPNDQQLIKLFRRLTLPFKKANRRYIVCTRYLYFGQ